VEYNRLGEIKKAITLGRKGISYSSRGTRTKAASPQNRQRGSDQVQLEVEVEEGAWKPVIRYDCAHGFAHLDRYNLKGDRDKQELPLSYMESLDLADKDINDNWDTYRERFLRGDFP
jgi:hypothetical protein